MDPYELFTSVLQDCCTDIGITRWSCEPHEKFWKSMHNVKSLVSVMLESEMPLLFPQCELVTKMLAEICSANDLLPDDTKPFSDQSLSSCQSSTSTTLWRNFNHIMKIQLRKSSEKIVVIFADFLNNLHTTLRHLSDNWFNKRCCVSILTTQWLIKFPIA